LPVQSLYLIQMRKLLFLLAVVCLSACSDAEKVRLRQTTKPTYDPATGKLKELTFDQNKNGTIDTWTEMNAARPVLTRMDRNEDGRLDRWEYHGPDGRLVKVGFSRKDDGKPDAWAYSGPDGRIERIEVSSVGDDKKIDRWEHYAGDGLTQAEDDTNADGRPDKWETYEKGVVKTASFDENGDGKPDRRFTYSGGALVLIETEPDASGAFTKRVDVK
jgi:hypothetical protein